MNPFDDSDNPYASQRQQRRINDTYTNPFDGDDKDYYSNSGHPPSHGGTGIGMNTNPFAGPYLDSSHDGGAGLKLENRNDDRSNTSSLDDNDDDDDEYDKRGRLVGDDNDDDDNVGDGDAPAEATWQYLGDLPYRRVPIYSNVTWERQTVSAPVEAQTAIASPVAVVEDDGGDTHRRPPVAPAPTSMLFHHSGLATYPHTAFKYHTKIVNPSEIRTLLSTTTKTIVCGCPNGGSIAAITIPLVGSSLSSSSPSSSASGTGFTTSQIHIWSNSGQLLTQIDFPPSSTSSDNHNVINITPGVGTAGGIATTIGDRRTPAVTVTATNKTYTAGDVVTMGFTNRTSLIVVLRDSLCYVYSLRGEILINPFFIFESNSFAAGNPTATSSSSSSTTASVEIVLATIYEGGVAVLATNKDSAIVELFDNHDDISYIQTTHRTSRIVGTVPETSDSSWNHVSGSSPTSTSHYAVITQLPTGIFAKQNYCHYCSIAVLPRTRTSSRHPEIFISTSDHTVLTVDASTIEIIDLNCRQRIPAAIIDMSFAPNGRFLACYTESSVVTVISTSFETKVLDFDTSEGSNLQPPTTMTWCGEDSVVLHWKNLGVLMIGPYGDWLRFPYEGIENLYIIPEIDCCRIITDSAVEILQRVPPQTALLLRIGSIEASAMLLDAADAFHSGSPSSDEAARTIIRSGMLIDAIETCTDSAMKEFDIRTQKRLLRAASYGMHFSYKSAVANSSIDVQQQFYNNSGSVLMGGPTETGSPIESGILPSETTVQFVSTARKLRVLNALRNPSVGFVLTSTQYDAMTPAGVVARLIAMKRPSLANAISKYLHLSKPIQLFARASKAAAFIVDTSPTNSVNRQQQHPQRLTDSQTAEIAIRIINGESLEPGSSVGRSTSGGGGGGGGGSSTNSGTASSATSTTVSTTLNRGAYATVAIAAQRAGRTAVANILLKLESSVPDKVPALVSTGAFSEAIAVATFARDMNFIFSVLMEYERLCTINSATDISKAQTMFLSTVISKFTPEAFHTLRRYLQTTSDVKSVTNLLIRAQKFIDAGEAIAKCSIREDDTREKQGLLAESSRIFGLGKDTTFHKICTDDYLELLKDQEILRAKYGSPDVCPSTSSVTGTIAAIIHFASTNMREQHRLLADADKLAKKYRVTDKRLWHIKVKAFAESNQWSSLRILADSRGKPPIGFKPFARAVIKGKQNSPEVLRYIEKITVPEERYDLFCEASQWKRALDEAFKMKDSRRILNVKTLCNSPDISSLADQMMDGLR